MGAVSAILYGSGRKDIRCLVLDSPFSDLGALIEEYVKKYKVMCLIDLSQRCFFFRLQFIAKVAGKYILRKLKENITKITGVEFEQVRPVDHISSIQCPVIFVHSNKDELINIKHSKLLFEVINCWILK